MKTYARIEDSCVVEIVSLNVKLETLYHPSLIWVDISKQVVLPQINYTYNNGKFTAPILKAEDALYILNNRLFAEMEKANQMIAPLQDAVDLGIQLEEETVRLAAWKKYRVLLNRIDTTKNPNIEWPSIPE